MRKGFWELIKKMKNNENKLHLALSPIPLAISLIPNLGEGSCYCFLLLLLLLSLLSSLMMLLLLSQTKVKSTLGSRPKSAV